MFVEQLKQNRLDVELLVETLGRICDNAVFDRNNSTPQKLKIEVVKVRNHRMIE